MFGTLTYDLKRKEPTFVENTNPSSALSRSGRDRPHISCEFCRTRKVSSSHYPCKMANCDYDVSLITFRSNYLRLCSPRPTLRPLCVFIVYIAKLMSFFFFGNAHIILAHFKP